MQVVIWLGIFSLFLIGCRVEPKIEVCTLLDTEDSYCFELKEGGAERWEKITNMLGWECVSPNDYGELKKHHKTLHIKLDEK